MTTGKDIASFFENGTTEQFEFCYKLYPQVLKLKAEKRGKKPQELIRLDEWYQNDLPKKIKARGKDAHLEYDELVQTMKWKQSRGKFYPQLSYLVKVNTPRAVMTETKKAFRKLPNLEQAITALSNLKGVGTTMASALLAAAAPEMAPFMADECLMAIPEIEGIDYTTKEYLNFVQHIQTTVARLNTQAGGEKPFWSPHRVELALWAHYVANDLSPELLDEMPAPGAGPLGTTNTNGNSKTKVLDENSEDNTNDVDEESMGLGANAVTTESETDNENTNPGLSTSLLSSAAVDGDSNFVSNDSTSQEQLLDENTTQTTATSTDDGDVGTPLASDSESNIEPPVNKLGVNNKSIQNKSITPQKLATVAEEGESQSIDNQLNNSNKSNSSNNNSPHKKLTVVGNGNGNGNGNGSLIVGADSLDGDSSSCALGTDDVVSEMDEPSDVDDGEDDMARMATADDSSSTAAVTLSANCSSLTNESNSEGISGIIGIGLGQKRAHNAFVSNSDNANSLGEQLLKTTEGGSSNSSQPESKKLRSE